MNQNIWDDEKYWNSYANEISKSLLSYPLFFKVWQKIMKYCTFNKLTLFIYTHNKQIIHSDLNNKIITVIQSQQYLDTGSNDTCRLLQR